MHRRIAALAIAILSITGCDSGGDADAAPADGSCQALVDDLVEIDDCAATLRDFDARSLAQCAAGGLGLPDPPPEPMVSGEAFQVAYAARCRFQDQAWMPSPQDCDISETLGCEG